MLGANEFTLNNFLSLLIEIGFSILFSILFCAIHYTLIKKTKLQTQISKSKAKNFWYFFGFGFILSCLSFVVTQLAAISINTAIGLPVTILGLIFAMSFFYNRSVSIGSIIPTIIWILYQYDGFTSFSWAWASRLIVYVLLIVICIVISFLKTKKWPTYLISLVIFFAGVIAVILSFRDDQLIFHIVEMVLGLISAIAYYAIISWLNGMLTNMSNMARSNLYTDESYIIPSALNNQFTQFVKNNNIEQALVVTFKLKNNNSNALKQLLDKLSNKKSLLFKTQYDTYGVVLCDNKFHLTNINECYLNNSVKDRPITDPLSNLQHLVKDIDVILFASAYGIHSNNLDELLYFNQYSIKQFDKSESSNQIQFFNSNMLNNVFNDQISYALLTQKVNLDEIQTQLELVELNKDKQQYVCPRFYWTKLFTCDLNKILDQFDDLTGSALLRHLAIKSIEAYSVSDYKGIKPLIIYYPISEMNSQFFSTIQFIKKLELYGINKNDIVLSFDCSKLKLWPRVVLDNLKELECNGINYIFNNVVNTYSLTLLKPKFVILDKSIEKSKNKLDKALDIAKANNQNILLTNVNKNYN